MNRITSNIVALVAMALALQACTDRPTPTDASGRRNPSASVVTAEQSGRYVVVFTAERVPADFADRVARLGGTIEAALDSIGVAAVTGLSDVAVTELGAAADIRAVEPDPMTSPRDDGESTDGLADEAASEAAVPADATASPTAAQFYARQWNLRAVFAPDAWAAGHLGSRDVVVAILDTGIDYTNPDLAGLVDLDRSISFVPEDVTRHYPGRLPFSDLFWHGTAVASVVASNAILLAGVNRYVTLLAVKVADSTNNHTVGRHRVRCRPGRRRDQPQQRQRAPQESEPGLCGGIRARRELRVPEGGARRQRPLQRRRRPRSQQRHRTDAV